MVCRSVCLCPWVTFEHFPSLCAGCCCGPPGASMPACHCPTHRPTYLPIIATQHANQQSTEHSATQHNTAQHTRPDGACGGVVWCGVVHITTLCLRVPVCLACLCVGLAQLLMWWWTHSTESLDNTAGKWRAKERETHAALPLMTTHWLTARQNVGRQPAPGPTSLDSNRIRGTGFRRLSNG